MKIYQQYKCKRLALGMSQKEIAAIARVDEGIYSIWENGGIVSRSDHYAIKDRVEEYIRSLDRRKYLAVRIMEENLSLMIEDESEHSKTLSHMMIHVAKLNMEYVAPVNRDQD